MKILILGGFLGAGKTTVLTAIAKKYLEDGGGKVAVIENEIGETPVDDKLLAGSGLAVRNLFSGCICCTLAGEIVDTVKALVLQEQPELLIIESSGVGYPLSIKQTLEPALGCSVRICCLADAKRWKRLRIPMDMILRDQFEGADIALINKCDLADSDTLEEVEKDVTELSGGAPVYRVCAREGLEKELLDTILGGGKR